MIAGESSMQIYAQLVEDIVDEIKMRKPESDVFALIGIVEFAVRNALDGIVKSSRDDECTIKQSDWRRAAMKLLEDPNWLRKRNAYDGADVLMKIAGAPASPRSDNSERLTISGRST